VLRRLLGRLGDWWRRGRRLRVGSPSNQREARGDRERARVPQGSTTARPLYMTNGHVTTMSVRRMAPAGTQDSILSCESMYSQVGSTMPSCIRWTSPALVGSMANSFFTHAGFSTTRPTQFEYMGASTAVRFVRAAEYSSA